MKITPPPGQNRSRIPPDTAPQTRKAHGWVLAQLAESTEPVWRRLAPRRDLGGLGWLGGFLAQRQSSAPLIEQRVPPPTKLLTCMLRHVRSAWVPVPNSGRRGRGFNPSTPTTTCKRANPTTGVPSYTWYGNRYSGLPPSLGRRPVRRLGVAATSAAHPTLPPQAGMIGTEMVPGG